MAGRQGGTHQGRQALSGSGAPYRYTGGTQAWAVEGEDLDIDRV
jgi:hypothetical protein